MGSNSSVFFKQTREFVILLSEEVVNLHALASVAGRLNALYTTRLVHEEVALLILDVVLCYFIMHRKLPLL